MAGMEPYGDIEIEFTGIRAGQKLARRVGHGQRLESVRRHEQDSRAGGTGWEGWDQMAEQFRGAAEEGDKNRIRELLIRHVPDYQPWEAG